MIANFYTQILDLLQIFLLKMLRGRTYNSFELESIGSGSIIKLIAVCNANVKDATHTSGLASTDGFFQYNSLNLLQLDFATSITA